MAMMDWNQYRNQLRTGLGEIGKLSPDTLNKAIESTKFPAEAESYSAKAQELMARHTIDHALLDSPDDDQAAPVGVRITIRAGSPSTEGAEYRETRPRWQSVRARGNRASSW